MCSGKHISTWHWQSLHVLGFFDSTKQENMSMLCTILKINGIERALKLRCTLSYEWCEMRILPDLKPIKTTILCLAKCKLSSNGVYRTQELRVCFNNSLPFLFLKSSAQTIAQTHQFFFKFNQVIGAIHFVQKQHYM